MNKSFDENQTSTSGICKKSINTNHKFLYCSICKYNTHPKCSNIDNSNFDKQKNTENFFCLKCREEIIPFQQVTDQQFLVTSNYCIHKHLDSLNIEITPNNTIKNFFQDINNLADFDKKTDDDTDDTPRINCNYTDIDSFRHKNNKNSFSLLRLNIASLKKHKEELETILSMIDLQFHVIGLTETKLQKSTIPTYNLNINAYNYSHTPTEAVKGGALVYISNKYNTKLRSDLNEIMYKSKELESIFIEIVNKNKKNTIIGCICCHPTMEIKEFNDKFFSPVVEKLNSEDKRIFLMGDYNIDLIKSDYDLNTSNFFDMLTT